MTLLSKDNSSYTILSIIVLCIPATLIYGQFLWNPLVFDDYSFFAENINHSYLENKFRFILRWLPYASFEWTRYLMGDDIIWLRLGNLALHLTTVIMLFLFLKTLFKLTIDKYQNEKGSLSPHWLAFFAALIFSLHPVSVYAVAYLTQRTILMATLFSILTWHFFMLGLIRKSHLWLFTSAAAFFFAVFSKETAIMAPAITVALVFLIKNKPIKEYWKLVFPTFLLYALIGIFIVFKVKSNNVLGEVYEPMAMHMLPKLGAVNGASNIMYPLSILNQSFLFFKYLWLWIVPNTAFMSIDMYQPFSSKLWSWPQLLGLIAFIIYPIIAIKLLLKQGIKGLLGFAMLCPWLLFATEFTTVRVQETFVLYRSYIWMVGAFAALPYLCQKLNAKQASAALLFASLLMMPLSLIKLQTFSHGLLLWDDAARLVERNGIYHPGMERVFFNRGNRYKNLNKHQEAIDDYTKVLELGGESSYIAGYAYKNRGDAYLKSHQFQQAINDFNTAINHKPSIIQKHLNIAISKKATAEKELAKIQTLNP